MHRFEIKRSCYEKSSVHSLPFCSCESYFFHDKKNYWSENVTPGYNALFYITARDGRNLKLQIQDYKLYQRLMGGPNQIPEWAIGNITLHWAADSSGNGIFRSDTSGVFLYEIPSTTHKVQALCRKGKIFLNMPISAGSVFTLFNALGMAFFRQELAHNMTSFNCASIAQGIYLFRITKLNQTLVQSSLVVF